MSTCCIHHRTVYSVICFNLILIENINNIVIWKSRHLLLSSFWHFFTQRFLFYDDGGTEREWEGEYGRLSPGAVCDGGSDYTPVVAVNHSPYLHAWSSPVPPAPVRLCKCQTKAAGTWERKSQLCSSIVIMLMSVTSSDLVCELFYFIFRHNFIKPRIVIICRHK